MMLTIEVTISDDHNVAWRATNHNDITISGHPSFDPRGERDTLLDAVRQAHYWFLVEKNRA